MYNTIIQYNDEKKGFYLKQKNKTVQNIDNRIKRLFKDLEHLARANSKEGITLVGLSAPQVGADLRAFIFLNLSNNTYEYAVNPRIVYTSKEQSSQWEGCASIGTGKRSLFGAVKRPRQCQIAYLNLDGEEKIFSGANFQSHILQHEIDHLEGVLFLDRLVDPTMVLTAEELDRYAEKNEGAYPKI